MRGTEEEYSKVHLQELSFLPNGPFVNKVPACARVNEDEDPDAKAGDEDKDATANAGHQKTQHEGGEATDPSTVSVDEAPDGDLQIESPTLEDDIEAGPNGEQLEVVVRNHQPVCGGDSPPELREYKRLSERKIKKRNEAMKEGGYGGD